MRKFLFLFFLISAFAPILPARAHGIIGSHIFLGPIEGNDANPDEALAVFVRKSGQQFSLGASLEWQLSDDASLTIAEGWGRDASGSRTRDGFQSGTALLKYALFTSTEHEMRVAIGPLLVVPSASGSLEHQSHASAGGEVLFAKGFCDLPDRDVIRYIRPLAMQGEFGATGRLSGKSDNETLANLEIEYSVLNLENFVQNVGDTSPLVRFVPYLQFNYGGTAASRKLHLARSPDFRLIPGIAWINHYCELSAGVQVALNGTAAAGDRTAFVGAFEVYFDELVPALGWKPF
jgi:hypothetical protein